MFRNIFLLTKISLLSTFSISGKKKRNILLYAFLLAYLAIAMGFLSYQILEGLIAIKQEAVFIGYILSAIVTLVLFTTIVSCINTCYFSKDNASLLSLPLKSYEILSAKINTVLIYIYFEEAILALVPFCLYGYMTSQKISFYLLLIPVLLLLPIIPLLTVFLIVMTMMAFLKGMRNKNLVQMITMTLSILFSLLISLLSSGTSTQEDAMQMMEQANGLVELYKKAFPTMPLALSTLIDRSILSLLGLLFISVLAYLVICFFCQELFFKGVLASLASSSGVSNKKIDEKKAYLTKGLPFSYVLKEIKVYLRNPTFFVQLVLPILLLPPFVMVIIYISIRSSDANATKLLVTLMQEKAFSPFVYALILIAMFFNILYSFIPMVAISKDGHDAYFMKYIPVPYHRQLLFKVIPDFMTCLYSWIICFLFMVFLFKVPVCFLLYSIPVFLGFSILHGFLILFDAGRPKLNWTSEIRVVKNNMRMLWGFAYVSLNVLIVALMGFVSEMSPLAITLILTIIYSIIIVFLYRYIKKKDIELAHDFN